MPADRNYWPWVGLAVLALVGIPAVLNKPRGLRNHNPMNVEAITGPDPWKGQVGIDTAGGRSFGIFGPVEGKSADFWGLRAGGHNFLSYQSLHGLYTLSGIINRATPALDGNDTAAYLAKVSAAAGVAPDAAIYLASNRELLARIMKAVTVQEQGYSPYPDDFYLQAAQAA